MTAALRAQTHDRRFYGVVSAIVTRNGSEPDDEESADGRVKVVFPWFDGGTTESDWCRIGGLYAGNDYGAAWIPEVGDEVVVAFVQGDMRMPIVLGGLHNGEDPPPTVRTPDVDQKLFRTKAGHEILLDDSSGSQRVVLKTVGEMIVSLDDAAGTLTVDTGKGTSIELDGSTITITGATVKVKAGQIDLGDGASDGLVLGDKFMTLFNAHTHNCTAPGSPSGPPLAPMMPGAHVSLANKTK